MRERLSPPTRIVAASSSHFSTRRAPSATGYPAVASAVAVAAPIPDDAPVTTAGRRSGWGSNRGIYRTSTRTGRAANPRTFTECTRSAFAKSTS